MLCSNNNKKSCQLIDNFSSELVKDDEIELDSLENESNNTSEDDSQQSTDEASSTNNVHELNLNGRCKTNDLDECYIDKIVVSETSDLKMLSLRSNGIEKFPNTILKLTSLQTLDLSNNSLLCLPPEIGVLNNLKNLFLDQNLLSVLPSTIWRSNSLRILKVANNRIAVLPQSQKGHEMRAIIFAESEDPLENNSSIDPLSTLNLRSNRLKGNIILGNYGNLTKLDLSENTIESLDLSAVEQLQFIQCSRNELTHLTLHGKNLKSLIAGNNKLKNLIVIHPPTNLFHLDISYNSLETLPNWIPECTSLRSLFTSNNLLTSLPDKLFTNDLPFLQTIQLAYNQLQILPKIEKQLPIQQLFLQNNSISVLPENLFQSAQSLHVLNLSNNRLCTLPRAHSPLLIEKLFLTANCLTDACFEKVAPFLINLKVLHLAYNNLSALSSASVCNWREIEEIVLSGNKLLMLPLPIGGLKHLAVLRVHSNLLQSIPRLSNLQSLRVLDLAHNQLDRIDLALLIPPNLKFLDLSYNSKLHVDSHQFNKYRTQRPMSLVDVSGKNRTSLPLTPLPFCENDLTDYSWTIGFSETAGSKPRLYVSQIRLPAFCNAEGLFGMFDGENNNNVPFEVEKIVPRILLEERTIKETANEYLKYTMLAAHRTLKDKGQKEGLSAIICHIVKAKQGEFYTRKYRMKIASVGDIRVVLGRGSGPVRLLPSAKQRATIRTNSLPLMVPDPEVCDLYVEEQDEFMIIANKNLWEVISPESAIYEVALQRNVILAAKRLQDLAQSYGAEDNLSIIVVKFNLIGSEVDLLMRELKQTIRKTKYSTGGGSSCQPGCCCAALNNECVYCLEKFSPVMQDRSSPSGQSEPACSDCNSSAGLFMSRFNENRVTRSFETIEPKTNAERRSYRGVARALRLKQEAEEKNEADTALSEEQFKCWEYMLEQNTQLLFDKELNTLNKKRGTVGRGETLSKSNPALSESGVKGGTVLSRQFGSTKSFNPLLVRSGAGRGASDKKQINGGPHAAYFGSLQRLMPYNLEYDFAVMHERGLADSLDLDRMQQYWGVTTTEL